jgi:acyl carrier protein
LASLSQGEPVAEKAPAAPRNATEEQLVNIWREVLNLTSLGIEDDFFALGGDSLRGIQVFSRIRKVFQVELPLKALFDQPTISGLALEIEKVLAKGVIPVVPPITNTLRRRKRAQLLAELDNLSADEIDLLLKDLSAAKASKGNPEAGKRLVARREG